MAQRKIINAHEHIESIREIPAYQRVMEQTGTTKTVFVGSPNYTLYLNPAMGFEKYHENNLQVLEIQRQYPDAFFAFVALNPLDKDNKQLLETYLTQGARGIKLYYGLGGNHGKGPFHSVPIDYEGMEPVFRMCEALDLPIIFHVNRIKFYVELLRFLKNYPKLKICFPHLMISLKTPHRLAKVARLLSRYPNIYTDCSYGRENHLLPIARHIADRNNEFRAFFKIWSHRIFFGTDLVITKVKLEKWGNYVEQMIKWYRAIIETPRYVVSFRNERHVFQGLNLPTVVQNRIYAANFLDFINSRVYTP